MLQKNVAASRTQTRVNFRGLFTFQIFRAPSLGISTLNSADSLELQIFKERAKLRFFNKILVF